MKPVQADGGENVVDSGFDDLEFRINLHLVPGDFGVQLILLCHRDKVLLKDLGRDDSGPLFPVLSNQVRRRSLLGRFTAVVAVDQDICIQECAR